MARAALHRLAGNPAVRRAVALVERLDSARPSCLRVLTYHRVDEGQAFLRQMEHLALRYAVVSVPRVLAAMEGGPALPPRAVLLTFDDAYRSFAEVAWPILRRHGFAAALFVPTAYPGRDEPRFWWDRLEQAFALTDRREPLPTAAGLLPLASAGERARAHAAVKRQVKDLPHRATLAAVGELCAALGQAERPHEVLGWDELRDLASRGVSLGAHTRTHPRLDRVPRAEARAEVLGSLADLEREAPQDERLFAYPDGRFDDELVELLRQAGVDLAFTTRRGTNDLHRSDRLRLRRLHVDAHDSLEVFRARLALSAARLERSTRLLDPPSVHERRAERAVRRARRRSRLVYRSLDAALTAGLRPPATLAAGLRRVLSPRCSHYERVGRLARWGTALAPRLGTGLERRLLDASRLPFRSPRVQLSAFGSGSTVFRLESGPDAARALALKVYRRTLGRHPGELAPVARRHRRRHRHLCEWFGDVVLGAEFLVVHAPLRGRPAVACLQPWLQVPLHDCLALDDRALLALLRAHPGLAERFAAFARRALDAYRRGFFPDLIGRGNLVCAEERTGARLLLIDYGIFHPQDPSLTSAQREALRALAARLESLRQRIESDVASSV